MFTWFATIVALLEASAFGADVGGSLVSAPPSVERMRSDLETQAGLIEKLRAQISDLQAYVKALPAGQAPVIRQAELQELRRRLKYLEENNGSAQDLTVLSTRVDAFEGRIGVLENRVGTLESALATNNAVDADQTIAIAALQEEVGRLDRTDHILLEDMVDLEVENLIHHSALQRRGVSLEMLVSSFQEVGTGLYYEFADHDLLWQRYPQTGTLLGGGMGLQIAVPPISSIGLQVRVAGATQGGVLAEALAVPGIWTDANKRVQIHGVLGVGYRTVPRSSAPPSVAREAQIAAYSSIQPVMGMGFGVTIVNSSVTGHYPSELVLRPEAKMAVLPETVVGQFGVTLVWRAGLTKN